MTAAFLIDKVGSLSADDFDSNHPGTNYLQVDIAVFSEFVFISTWQIVRTTPQFLHGTVRPGHGADILGKFPGLFNLRPCIKGDTVHRGTGAAGGSSLLH